MGLIRSALRKPITILVLVAGLLFFGLGAVRTIKIDIFPDMNLPVIYISHPYGGFTPDQMETYFGKQYVNLLLYVGGVKSIETRNIQGLTLIKLTFYEGTNMAQAASEVTGYTTRAQASFPPGSQPPFILRFDASTLPVGQLVLSSPKSPAARICLLALRVLDRRVVRCFGILCSGQRVPLRAPPGLRTQQQASAQHAVSGTSRQRPGDRPVVLGGPFWEVRGPV